MREYEDLNLLSPRQLRSLFPESVVAGNGLPVFPNSIISYWRKEQTCKAPHFEAAPGGEPRSAELTLLPS